MEIVVKYVKYWNIPGFLGQFASSLPTTAGML